MIDFADVTQLQTDEEVLSAIEHSRAELQRKVKQQSQVTQAKKDIVSSYNEQLKEIKEEVQALVDHLDALEAHLHILDGTAVLQKT